MDNVKFAGRVGCDPNLKIFDEKKAVCSFVVYVNRDYKIDGKLVSDKHPIEVWGHSYPSHLADNMKKGQIVEILGELRNNDYEKDNVKRELHPTYFVEVGASKED